MQVIHTKIMFSKVVLAILPSLLFLLFNTSISALTYQNSVDVEFTFNPTIGISLSNNNLIIDNLTPGASSDSNIITVGIETNAGFGYYMSATAGISTGNTNLTSTANSDNIFTSLSSNATTLSNIPDNYWGYSYSTDEGSTWISGSQGDTSAGYNGLPLDNDDSGATGIILASTNSFASTGSVQFKIGAKASNNQPSGVYTNTINFYAIANPEPTLGPSDCVAGNICYEANSLTTYDGSMGQQTKDDSGADISDGATVTLLASNFSRTGYGFAGWSDTYDYSGNLYGPQETITVPTGTATNGLTLYAIWIKSEGSLQDSTTVSRVCNSLTAATPSTAKTLASVSALTDQRDNNTYAIAKLADGKCWMIENLRLDNTADHNTDGTLAQGYGTSATYGNFGGLAGAESTNFLDSTTANSLYYSGTQSGDATINIGTTDNPGYRMPRYNNRNTSSRASNPTNNSGNMYSYGNYYTWSAAMANTTYYDSPTATDADEKTSETVNTSLCPTGWRLPYGRDTGNGTTTGGFYNLNYKINNDSNVTNSTANLKLRSFPNNFLYSGYFVASSVNYRGYSGSYWSSTSNNSSNSYYLSLSSPNVFPGTQNVYKYRGLSIRCTVSVGT